MGGSLRLRGAHGDRPYSGRFFQRLLSAVINFFLELCSAGGIIIADRLEKWTLPRQRPAAIEEAMNRLMFVYLSGTEKGKTRIFTQDRVTLGTSDSSDLKLVPEEGGSLPEGAIADVYSDGEVFHLVPRGADSLEIMVNGEPLGSSEADGYLLHDGDTVHFGHGLSSATLLFQVLPANFGATHPVPRVGSHLEQPSNERVHPLTATLFVKELTASLWAEIPRTLKVVVLTMLAFLVSLIVAAVVYNFIALHRNNRQVERLQEQMAADAARRQEDQSFIRSQQQQIENLRQVSEQTRLFAQNISERYSHGVCLIVGSYSFIERGTGRPLRYESADKENEPPVDQHGNLLVSVNGAGPAVQIEWTGTGFVVEEGVVVTNKHVVQPTTGDPFAQIIIRQGAAVPRLDALVAFFPSIKTPFDLKVQRVSDRHDLALCTFVQGNVALPTLPISSEDLQSIVGEPVVLLGYPTGVDGLLQRIDENERKGILSEHGRSAEDVARGLAEKGLIRPLTTTGVISDALPMRVVHSAHTTEGGSGGPLFDREGRVIAVNQAVLTAVDGSQSFGGSNFGVPIKAVSEFLVAYHQAK